MQWESWHTLYEQRRVYHEVYGMGIATCESNEGRLFIHFDDNPWFPKKINANEIKEVK